VRTKFALLAVVLFTVGCDRVTKHMAASVLAGAPSRSYFSSTVRFEYAENAGAFLSLGAELPESIRIILFTLGGGAFLIALTVIASRRRLHGLPLLAVGLIASGGASNLLDRVIQGTVIDFMDVGVGSVRTGIFNVADIAIFIGVIVFAGSLRRSELPR